VFWDEEKILRGERGMALKFYGMYSIYFIILIHIISNYLAIFTYMYSCNI